LPRTAAGIILQVVAAVEDKIMDEFSKKFGIAAFPILIIILKINMFSLCTRQLFRRTGFSECPSSDQ